MLNLWFRTTQYSTPFQFISLQVYTALHFSMFSMFWNDFYVITYAINYVFVQIIVYFVLIIISNLKKTDCFIVFVYKDAQLFACSHFVKVITVKDLMHNTRYIGTILNVLVSSLIHTSLCTLHTTHVNERSQISDCRLNYFVKVWNLPLLSEQIVLMINRNKIPLRFTIWLTWRSFVKICFALGI